MTVSCAYSDNKPIKAMILTGQMNPHHRWEVTSAAIERHLHAAGIFDITRVITPEKGSDMSGFSPDWDQFDVIVIDYDGDEWPAHTRKAFEHYMEKGGGLVTVHSTDNAFPEWKEWNLMIGVGGWGGRNEKDGPAIRWRDCEMVLDHDLKGGATHPPQHDFLITIRNPNHPVTKGMPELWLHAHDECYSRLRGPAQNVDVLATGWPDPKFENVTGEHEPVLMAIRYGEGRIFHTTLGHCGRDSEDPVPCVHCVGFISTLQRGTEWAATGEVSLPIPEDFPTAYQLSIRNPE